ncbi:MAG TPA: ThiF family adenylyltransferase [Thermoanaerobaculia bacterium]
MSTSYYSAALPEAVHRAAVEHLVRKDGQEDLCFGLWYPSVGERRMSGLVAELLLPHDRERRVHGNASFLPHYFERALHAAVEAGAGLAFFHSHPGPGWQGMSNDDVVAEKSHAAAVKGATGLPFLGLTIGTDGAWSARFWEKTAPRVYERRWCSLVRVVGEQLRLTYNDALLPVPSFKEALSRTVSAWGPKAQADLARLTVGVIGAGSVGYLVAENLARTGIARVKLIDFDSVETVNLDRLLFATPEDARKLRAKVSVLARALKQSATADHFQVDAIEFSIAEEEGFRAALDCDVLFSCVDRPWPRQILNFIAYAHLIPVVDGGIQITTTSRGTLKEADWRAHIVSPERRCLECLGQYDPGMVSTDRDGYFDDPRYIAGLPSTHLIRRNENVFAFSMNVAGLEMLQFLKMVVAPMGFANAGEQLYHFVPGIFEEPEFHTCKAGCVYPGLTAKGDRSGVTVTGRHPAAEKARDRRRPPRGTFWNRISRSFGRTR